eukprot:TRINITY_DN3343_c0_g1_i1.p1 TRINITY_DN3343_c0_g1~~TRINITY_DN3343_c0_g1_i1.p1  ORF type:complete len:796 (+),score=260.60 TRINITY_DN3343_c0_g1_i1:335-2722(+)
MQRVSWLLVASVALALLCAPAYATEENVVTSAPGEHEDDAGLGQVLELLDNTAGLDAQASRRDINGKTLTDKDRARKWRKQDRLKDAAAVEMRNVRKLLMDKMANFKKNLKGFRRSLGREALAPMLAQFREKLNTMVSKYHQKIAYLQQELQTSSDITAPPTPVNLPVPEIVPGAPVAQDKAASKGYSAIVPLYHYFNTRLSDNFYTTNFNTLRTGIREWTYKGIAAFVYKRPSKGTVPLYKFWNIRMGDHRFSTERQTPAGYQFKGIVGYVAKKQGKNTVALYSYLSNSAGDSLVTTDQRTVPAGYSLQATEGYVYPPKYIVNPNETGKKANRVPMLIPLYRYFNPRSADHFYTTNWKELNRVTDMKDWNFEGIAGMVMSEWEPGTVPLYRFWNIRTLDHFYTINKDAVSQNGKLNSDTHGWKNEGIECFVYPFRQESTVPFFRYYNHEAKDHFYTTNSGDLGFGKLGYTFQGVSAFIHPAPPILSKPLPAPTKAFAPVPLFRYYKPGSHDHFYSTKVQIPLEQMKGWVPEGVAAAVYTEQVPGTVPLYRYYQPLYKDHLYTTKRFPNGKMGYKSEGIECYVRATPKPGFVPLYRFFNQKYHDHYYTTDPRDLVQQADKSYKYKGVPGWYYYGIQAYVFPPTLPQPNEIAPVYRYYSKDRNEHLYTFAKKLPSSQNYKFEGARFFAVQKASNGAVPLHHYFNAEYNDHILSTKVFTEKVHGWKKLADIGNVYKEQKPGTVPIYMFFNPRVYDHFYTSDKSELVKGTQGYVYKGIGGWRFYGVQFYTFTKTTATP